MQNTKKQDIPELLRRLSRQTLADFYLGNINGSDIYQVQAGWQQEILSHDSDVVVVNTGTEFETAVASSECRSIYVPKKAVITQEIAERILQRNPLSKTVFWEAGE